MDEDCDEPFTIACKTPFVGVFTIRFGVLKMLLPGEADLYHNSTVQPEDGKATEGTMLPSVNPLVTMAPLPKTPWSPFTAKELNPVKVVVAVVVTYVAILVYYNG